MDGKLSDPRTPFAFMSRTRSWTLWQPARMSANDVGSMPYSAGGRPATAFRPMLGSSAPRNAQTSVPSSLRTGFGASSAYLAGRRPSHMSGGSTTWSSTLTRMRSSISMSSDRAVEAEDANGVAGEDRMPLVGRDVAHVVVDRLARDGP